MRARLRDLPMIGGVQSAASVYQSVVPIRGTTTRPLANRRAKHYTIDNPETGVYVCKLYGHHVLRYESAPDKEGTLLTVNLCGYDTITTRGFIRKLTPFDCYSHNGKTYIEIGLRTKEVDGKYKVTGAYHLPEHHPLQIYIPDWHAHGKDHRESRVLNPVPVMKKVLDREVTKELRDKYKEEMVAAESMLRLGTPRYGEEYDPRQRQSYFRGQFMVDLTSEEMSEYLWLVAGFEYSGDRIQVQKYVYNIKRQVSEPVGNPTPTYRSYIVNALYHIAALDAITIHKEVEMPVGQRA